MVTAGDLDGGACLTHMVGCWYSDCSVGSSVTGQLGHGFSGEFPVTIGTVRRERWRGEVEEVEEMEEEVG